MKSLKKPNFKKRITDLNFQEPDEELKNAIDMLSISDANGANHSLWLSTAWNVRNKTLNADITLRRSLGIILNTRF